MLYGRVRSGQAEVNGARNNFNICDSGVPSYGVNSPAAGGALHRRARLSLPEQWFIPPGIRQTSRL